MEFLIREPDIDVIQDAVFGDEPTTPEISVVIPAYNEQDSIPILYKELKAVLPMPHEIIFIDDGSTDDTTKNLNELHIADGNVKIITFRKNFGQTAALDAGFKAAKGQIIVSLDADLQDNPAELPRLLAKLDDKQSLSDVVCAWRKNRKDSFNKRIFSKGANFLRDLVLGKGVHDSGCTFRVYRREALEGINLFGEMHRYLPYLLLWRGFNVTELEVNHRQRVHGKTKYGLGRLLKGFLDMFTMAFWMKYSTRPMHLFGGLGAGIFGLGFISGCWLLVEKFIYGLAIASRPLLMLTVLLLVLGTQLALFGIIGDILVKIYYKDNTQYTIKNSKPERGSHALNWVSSEALPRLGEYSQ